MDFFVNGPLLIDTEFANKELQWFSTDNLENFSKQTLNFKRTHSEPIVYKFNSLGYRTKELDDLNKDFLLTFGCSYTEGVGLLTEQIWNNAISKYLNLDLYNCAKQATGMDIQYYNSVLWKNSNLPLPKIVIVQWPHKERKQFAFMEDNKIRLNDMSQTPTRDGKWWGKRYIVDIGEMALNAFMWFESFNNIWESLDVPVLNFTWDSNLKEHLTRSRYKLWHIIPENYDKARDNGHDGPLFHADTSNQIIEIIKQSNFTYKI